ncbi:gamma-glutamyltransferase [Stenotrophobium rhamnosiphilum]|uniref:Glutathione hydrolase proenzyme n=1 Tax=Stenotrophobium rhamnosiphilum TaxID=2029166 RepID=A0A2T5MJ85_9GAMM|nr:gamma-glutamyltransferase [Stenotrophobium rhamnosiphilum]PTU32641.1 gamma-glutamyltransferase [Stenotrophobium rhamnosiphilum]
MKKLLIAGFLLLPALVFAGDKLPGYAVSSATPEATKAGLEVLAAGGNAFDAAVAVSAALAVTEPTGSGLGGGGFWLLHRESDGMEVFVDGRETAPYAANAKMYQDKDGKAVDALSRDGALAAAIPGEPAALELISKKYGALPLKRSLAPAVRLAREGFTVNSKLAEAFASQWPRLSINAKATFAQDGRALREGEVLRQTELARTLELIAMQGGAGFYEGETATELVAASRAAGGIWTEEDLRRYAVVERKPLVTWFRDTRIVTAPPPSAGGVTLAELFNQLELLGYRSDAGVDSKHLIVESLRRAYRDRAAYLADPDFVNIPVFRLTSRSYARDLVASIDPKRATPSASLPPAALVPEGNHTTHFSVVDAEGNRVAATLSINLPFGSGFMAPGTGVLLNDEMDDFAASTTASNAYGLIGSEKNLVAPGKRPLSSMTPTFVEGPRGLLVIGTPGGSRIITMVALGILGWLDGLDAQQVVALPRYHHQYLPDVIQFEANAFSVSEQAALRARGHTLEPVSRSYGLMNVVTWDPKTRTLKAASDPRALGEGSVVLTKSAN